MIWAIGHPMPIQIPARSRASMLDAAPPAMGDMGVAARAIDPPHAALPFSLTG